MYCAVFQDLYCGHVAGSVLGWLSSNSLDSGLIQGLKSLLHIFSVTGVHLVVKDKQSEKTSKFLAEHVHEYQCNNSKKIQWILVILSLDIKQNPLITR